MVRPHGLLGARELDQLFTLDSQRTEAPRAVVNDFEELLDLVAEAAPDWGINQRRPPRRPPRQLPPPRVEPDWHPAVAKLTPPAIILFDWHATLVDTLDAMYRAVDDVLPELESLGLTDRLVSPAQSKTCRKRLFPPFTCRPTGVWC